MLCFSLVTLAGTPLLNLRGGQIGTETQPSYLMPAAVRGIGPAYMAPVPAASSWEKLRSLLEERGEATADGEAREEAAYKLIENHVYVLKDVTHTHPCTQTALARLDLSLANEADQVLREIARRLLRDRPGAGDLEETLQASNDEQKRAWRGVATFLDARLQNDDGQHPGRKPDMSEAAAAAMRAVLREVAAEADCALTSQPAPPCERSNPRHHLMSPYFSAAHFAGA